MRRDRQRRGIPDLERLATDRASGKASTAEIFANGKRLRIWDENDRECITHYTLRAVNDDTGQTAESDPIIDNRGRR